MNYSKFKSPDVLSVDGCKFTYLDVFDKDYLDTKTMPMQEIKQRAKMLFETRDKFKKLITNFNNLSLDELFELYKTFYYVDVDKLKMDIAFARFNSPKVYKLKTNDYVQDIKITRTSTTFNWRNIYQKAMYTVVAEDGSINEEKTYSKYEVQDLVKEGRLALINIEGCGKEMYGVPKHIGILKDIVIPMPISDGCANYLTKTKECYYDFDVVYNGNQKALELLKNDMNISEFIYDYGKFINTFREQVKSLKIALKDKRQEISSKINELKDFSDDVNEFERSL